MLTRLLDSLNEAQREAVLCSSGPLLVSAGAGSGKTRVIIAKIAYLIEHEGVKPCNIMGVTFTNKAAGEMRERASKLNPAAASVSLKTFHSFGAWLLRNYGAALRLDPNFRIYDDEDQLTLLHSAFPAYKRKDLKWAQKAISRAKDELLTPQDKDAIFEQITQQPEFIGFFEGYERRLRASGNLDFADLIGLSYKLLAEHRDVRERFQKRFTHILVDEYQDINNAQFMLLSAMVNPEALAAGRTHLCVVGDDDQSIYKFRGARVENILEFDKQFSNTRIIKLEENYRSSGNILAAASSVIANNRRRLGKDLFTRTGSGAPIKMLYIESSDDEVRYIARMIQDNPVETAILYRTNAQAAAFQTTFAAMRIPFQVVGALRFVDTEEVKDALAMLGALVNPRDEVGARRIIKKYAAGVGEKSLGTILEIAQNEFGGDIWGAIADHEFGKSKKSLVRMVSAMKLAQEELEKETLAVVLSNYFEHMGLLAYYKNHDEEEGSAKMETLDSLFSMVASYPDGRDGLLALLESLALDPPNTRDERRDGQGVTLITIHNTKGLEYDRVFLTGMEEGLFPSGDPEEIEEERRLCYVAITRARKELIISASSRRLRWGHINYNDPSRFIGEMPEELLEVVDMRASARGDAGYGQGAYGQGSQSQGGYGSYGQGGARRSRGSADRSYLSHSAQDRRQAVAKTRSHEGSSRRWQGIVQGTQHLKSGARREASVGIKTASGVVLTNGGQNGEELSFLPGTGAYHPDLGAGYVLESRKDAQGRELVKVKFDSGQVKMFFAGYSPLEKMPRED